MSNRAPGEAASGGPAPLFRGETGSATIGGVRLAYRRWPGPTAGRHRCPPVVLLHGLLQSGDGMANLAAHLARHGAVVVPDLRGRGASDQPADGYDPATMEADVAGLIAALDLDRPVVVGRLHGGLLGYHLAARHPQAIRGLVLGDTAPEIGDVRAAASLAAVRALPRRFATLDDALAFYQERLGLSAARAHHDIPHDLVDEGAAGYRWRHNLDLIERIEAAAMPRSDWDLLATIQAPVLLLRGQRGEVPPTMAERFRQTVRHGHVQTVFGARHDVFLGPGAEQAFGAVDLFLMQLPDRPASAPQAPAAQLPLADTAAPPAAPDQLPLPGAEAPAVGPTHQADAAVMVERIVRAINGRDDAAIAALFTADARIVQYRPGGKLREGGIDAARAAFWELFAGRPDAAVVARDIVTATDGQRVAAVLVLHATGPIAKPSQAPEDVILAPIFLVLRGDQIAEFVSYGLRLPADDV